MIPVNSALIKSYMIWLPKLSKFIAVDSDYRLRSSDLVGASVVQCTGVKDIHGSLLHELDRVRDALSSHLGTIVWLSNMQQWCVVYDGNYTESLNACDLVRLGSSLEIDPCNQCV